MTELSIEQALHYQFVSQLRQDSSQSGKLILATAKQGECFPYFFQGRILHPRPFAHLLHALSRVVSTRYYYPPNMLKRIISERDPVITSGGGILRFEGFSACCSTYARVDIRPEAYQGQTMGHGTTNVDFNAPLRAAFASMTNQDRLALSVGCEEFAVKQDFTNIVEKKVSLPTRWIKSFVEVQAYEAQMQEYSRIDKIEAMRFLRSLPTGASGRSTFFLLPTGKGLRLSQIASKDTLKIGGIERLHLLGDLAAMAQSLTIYAHPLGEASQWQLTFPGDLFFNLTITAEPARGFSGEGQVLTQLTKLDTSLLNQVRASLKWQPYLDLQKIADDLALSPDIIQTALATLGSRGLVGYDLSQSAYFHRELPFDLSAVEDMHPRLKAARKLVDNNEVRNITEKENEVYGEVRGSDVWHMVTITATSQKCSCVWFAKHQGTRGPCKHILALKLSRPGSDREATKASDDSNPMKTNTSASKKDSSQ